MSYYPHESQRRKKSERVEMARALLTRQPMTRVELCCFLEIPQQRAPELLRLVGATIVGSRPAPRQGRPAPIYGLGEPDDFPSQPVSLANLTCVWELGARA
jgi:predicted ArsR family transcriptional regulator